MSNHRAVNHTSPLIRRQTLFFDVFVCMCAYIYMCMYVCMCVYAFWVYPTRASVTRASDRVLELTTHVQTIISRWAPLGCRNLLLCLNLFYMLKILEQIELYCSINRSEEEFKRNQTSTGFEHCFTNVSKDWYWWFFYTLSRFNDPSITWLLAWKLMYNNKKKFVAHTWNRYIETICQINGDREL